MTYTAMDIVPMRQLLLIYTNAINVDHGDICRANIHYTRF